MSFKFHCRSLHKEFSTDRCEAFGWETMQESPVLIGQLQLPGSLSYQNTHTGHACLMHSSELLANVRLPRCLVNMVAEHHSRDYDEQVSLFKLLICSHYFETIIFGRHNTILSHYNRAVQYRSTFYLTLKIESKGC